MGAACGLPPNRTVPVGLPLKRTLYMPPAAIAAVGIGMSVMGGISQGRAAQKQGEAEAAYLSAQADQERLALDRDLADYDREASRSLARSRAVMAANGGDTTTGGALDTLSYQQAVFGENRQRLLSDSDARIRGLNVRAESARSAGKDAMWGAIFSGFGKGLSQGSSVFKFGGGTDAVVKSRTAQQYG